MDVAQTVLVIETALVAGATSAVQDQASAAATSAAQSLRDGLRRLFGGADGERAVAVLQEPETVLAAEVELWRRWLDEQVQLAAPADMEDLLARARQVLEQIDAAGVSAGTYRVGFDQREARGLQSNVGGTGHSQTNTFS